MLSLLLVEDSAEDAELIAEELRRQGIEFCIRHVQSESEFCIAFQEGTWDLVLTDFALPLFTAMTVLNFVKSTGSDVPVILLTGIAPEDTAVDFMKRGGADFLLKKSLKRLGSAIAKALERVA